MQCCFLTYGKRATGSIVHSRSDNTNIKPLLCIVNNDVDSRVPQCEVYSVVKRKKKKWNAPVALHPKHSLIIIVCWLLRVHVLNCIHSDRWQTKKKTMLMFFFHHFVCCFLFWNMFYYNSLQWQREKWSILNTTKEIHKFDRCLFGWSYFPVWIPIPYDMLQNEMIKGKKRPQRFWYSNWLLTKGNHFKLGITCCVYYQPLQRINNQHTYAHITEHQLHDC